VISTSDIGGGGVTIEVEAWKKEREGKRLTSGAGAQTTLPRQSAAVYAAAPRKENLHPN